MGSSTQSFNEIFGVSDKTQNQPAAHSETLSQEANNPNDKSKPPQAGTDTAKDKLPAVTITSDTAATGNDTAAITKQSATLDAQAVKQLVDDLHKAIHRHNDGFLGIGGGDDPDNDKIKRLLEPLNQADREAVEKAYSDKYGKNGSTDTLRAELKDKLSKSDWLTSEATLNREDGRTNDAGNLIVALSKVKDDRGKGEKEVREIFANLNSEQIAQLDKDFHDKYGEGFQQALDDAKLSDDTKKALGWLTKGVDKRSAQDIEDYARFAVDKKNLDMLGEALRGDFPQAKEAREALQKDADFKKKIVDDFKPRDKDHDGGILGFGESLLDALPGGGTIDGVIHGFTTGDFNWAKIGIGLLPGGGDAYEGGKDLYKLFSTNKDAQRLLTAMDYLNEGHISLSTVAITNTGSLWGLFDDKGAIKDAAKNATDEERKAFATGRDLVMSGKQPSTDDERQSVEFYNRIHKAFDDAGDRRETAEYEANLLYGPNSLIAQMAETHSNGGPFGIGSGHGRQDIFSKVENLSEEDWKRLRDPKEGPQFRKDIENSLQSYTSDDERTRLLALVDQKAKAETYEEAQKIHRSLADMIKDNGDGGKRVPDALTNLSAEDIQKYHSDTAFKASVDGYIHDHLNETEQLYSTHLLKQVADTGKAPVESPTDKVLKDKIDNASAEQSIRDIEAALKDETLRKRLSVDENSLSGEDKILKQAIVESLSKQVISSQHVPPEQIQQIEHLPEFKKFADPLFQTGHIPVDLKLELGLNKKDLLSEIATAPADERQRAEQKLNQEERQLVDVISQQNGKLTPVDQIRQFAIGAGGNYQDFQGLLSGATYNQIEALKDEYAKKYGSSLNNDLLDKVSDKDKQEYKNYLTPAATDGRQDYFENLDKFLSRSGVTADGSEIALQRATELHGAALAEYQRIYQTLPKEKQEALDKYFGDAYEQYKNSKTKLAEIAVDAAITAAALAAAPFTGGASLGATVAIIAGAAAAGAAFRLAAVSAIEGNDFDWSAKNVTEQLVRGGVAAAVNFIGPQLFHGVTDAFAGVATTAVADASAAVGDGVISESAGTSLSKGLSTILAQKGVNSGEEVASLVEKALPAATDAQKATIAETLSKSVSNNLDSAVQEATSKVVQQAASEGATALTEGSDAAASAGSQAVKQFAKRLGTDVIENAAIGSGAGVISELAVAPFNPDGIDWNRLKTAALTGLAVGATLPVVIHGATAVIAGAKDAVTGASNYIVNLRRTADGIAIVSEEQLAIRGADGVVHTIKPGEPYVPQDGDQVVSGKTLKEGSGGGGNTELTTQDAPSSAKTTANTTDPNSTDASSTHTDTTSAKESPTPHPTEPTSAAHPADSVDANAGSHPTEATTAPAGENTVVDFTPRPQDTVPIQLHAADPAPQELANWPPPNVQDRLFDFQPDLSAKGPSVEFEGFSGPFFRAKVRKAYNGFPPEIRQLLDDQGVRVVAARKLSDAFPELQNVRPRGWTEGSTWDNADGVFNNKDRAAVVAKKFRAFDISPEGQVASSSFKASDRVEGVLRHEVGHAVDDSLGRYSMTPEFRQAYAKDIANLPETVTINGQQLETKKLFQYFLQPETPGAGESEAFAEIFAAKNGGGGSAHLTLDAFHQAFPETTKAIESRLDSLREEFVLRRQAQAAQMTHIEAMADGSTQEIYSSGFTRTMKPDGTIVERYPNNQVFAKSPDGTEVTIYPDGTKISVSPDGTTNSIYADKTASVIHPNGERIDTYPNKVRVTTSPDGNYFVQRPDGSSSAFKTDGSQFHTDPAGNAVEIDAAGVHTNIYNTGVVVRDYPNGVRTTWYQNNGSITQFPDGSYAQYNAEGNLISHTPQQPQVALTQAAPPRIESPQEFLAEAAAPPRSTTVDAKVAKSESAELVKDELQQAIDSTPNANTARSLSDLRSLVGQDSAATPAGQDLFKFLESKGMTAEQRTLLEAQLQSADIAPNGLKNLQEMAAKERDPLKFVSDAISWSKGGKLAPALEKYRGLPSLLALRNTQSDNQAAIAELLDAITPQTSPEDAQAVMDLVSKSARGEVVLLDSSHEFRGNGPFNPKASPDVCTAATSAFIDNQTLTTAQIVARIDEALKAPAAGGRDYMNAIIPIAEGKPQLTAEHIQSIYGDASTPKPVGNYRQTYEDAGAVAVKYMNKAIDAPLERFDGDLATAPDGAYALNVDMLQPIDDPARPHADVKTRHAMAAIVKDHHVTYYDPLYGKSYTELPADYRLIETYKAGNPS